MSERRRAQLLWWVFFALSVVVIYNVVTLDVKHVRLIDTNTTYIKHPRTLPPDTTENGREREG